MKEERYEFNRLGVRHARLGECSVIEIAGHPGFMRVGDAWWLLGVRRDAIYKGSDVKISIRKGG